MPVDTPHAEYAALCRVWRICRDVVGGSRFVKNAGRYYLPGLADQSPVEYEKYKGRALFFNATGITVSGLHGLIFAKEPTVKSPSQLDPILLDVTLQKIKFIDYAKAIVREQITHGRAGTLIDFNPDENRPYVSRYMAENILNWKTDRIKGEKMLTLLVLFEYDPNWIQIPNGPDRPPDDFDTTQYEQWRVYRLNLDDVTSPTAEPYVTCTVYRRAARQVGKKTRVPSSLTRTGAASAIDNEFVVVNSYTPTRRSKTLTEIPFVFHGAEFGLPDCDKSPIEDICEINISHYQTSADLENGRHLSGLPQPFVTGHKEAEDDDAMMVGSTVLWTFADPEAKVGYLEVTSEFAALTTALEEKQSQMAVLGARLLEPQKAGVEAADTQRLRLSSQTSTLTNISLLGSSSLTTVLKWLYWWSGTEATVSGIKDEVCEIKLNTDFLDESMNPLLLQQLLAALVARKISFATWFNALQKGELIDADRTAEEEQADIETEAVTMAPPMPPGLMGNPPPGQQDDRPPFDPADPTNPNNQPKPGAPAAKKKKKPAKPAAAADD